MTPYEQWVALLTLMRKEIRRYTRIWTQTLLPSAITMSLYFLIFGNLIGSRIGEMGGVSYMEFVVPGLIMMAIVTNSYANVVSSFFGSKFNNSIEELLVSPTPNHIILLGFVSGGVSRGMLVAVIVTLVASLFVDLSIHSYIVVVAVVAMTSILFSLCGLINAVFANTFDDINIVPAFVLTPVNLPRGRVLLSGLAAGILGNGFASQSVGLRGKRLPLWCVGSERCQRWICVRHDRGFHVGGVLVRGAFTQNRSTVAHLKFMKGVLGQAVPAPLSYAPHVLERIERHRPFSCIGHGWDIWHCYEMSWCVQQTVEHWVGVLAIPADSPATVESKSLKLYLNSLNHHHFETHEAAIQAVVRDVSACVSATVSLSCTPVDRLASITRELVGVNLPACNTSEGLAIIDATVLTISPGKGNVVSEHLVSHSLRSLCPVTAQPDWGSLWVRYSGPPIDPASLATYLDAYPLASGLS